MKKAIYHLIRDNYQELTTLGELKRPDGSHFGWTLEDVVRPYGIKDKGYTAIPATEGDDLYYMEVRTSPKFGDVVVVYTEKEDKGSYIEYTLKYKGVEFKYILFHGGNNHTHSEGCILVAKNRNDKNRTIQGSLKKELHGEVKKLLDDGYQVRLRVTNKPQNG